MATLHPHKNDHGQSVTLTAPSIPTDLSSWADATRHATVIPQSPMPATLNGIMIESWHGAPADKAGWERLAASAQFPEPAFVVKSGTSGASGVVVVESDGRVWVVSPSNRFGGYTNTFPKGKLAPSEGLSLRANAIKEAHEETGLKIELTAFLVDSERSTSTTRYYLGRRAGGNPADMGWESQAVQLVPRYLLPAIAAHQNDQAIRAALDIMLPALGQ